MAGNSVSHVEGRRMLTRTIDKVRLLAERDPEALVELDAFLAALLARQADPLRRGILRAMLQTGAKTQMAVAPDLGCPACGECDADKLLVAVPGAVGVTCLSCGAVYMPPEEEATRVDAGV